MSNIINCFKDKDQLAKIKEFIPIEEEIFDLADFFKVFGDPTRLRILFLLSEGELCVHDISSALNMEQTAISHQLRSLRQVNLVRYRKEGRHAHYALNDNHVKEILKTGLEHTQE